MEKTARVSSLESEYSELFSEQALGSLDSSLHPAVSKSVENKECEVCGNKGNKVRINIKNNIESDICPLCESSISNEKQEGSAMSKLKEIDKKIEKEKNDLKSIKDKKERLEEEVNEARNNLEEAKNNIKDFEAQNE